MGCTESRHDHTVEGQNHKAVEAYLKDARAQDMLDFKVLLLGAGESGKSTVIKQLKSIYKTTMDEAELQSYAINIHKNTLQSMHVLLDAAANLGIVIKDPKMAARAETVVSCSLDIDLKRLPVEVGEAIEALWTDPDIKEVWSRRSEFWFLDATPYYFENVARFIEDTYTPNEEDIIMTRVRTTGIAVTEFDEGPVHYRVVDVGGQRNERKKWMHCFDDVKCLLFVVNLAGYDQVMFEDPSQNRMVEALQLFAQIVNTPGFENIPIFLFLNKKDIFEQMVQQIPLSKCFPEYSGGLDPNSAFEFISEQFKRKMNNPDKPLYVKYIAARFKRDVRYTWDEVKQVLADMNKKDVKKATKHLNAKDRA
eukprot:TRINITY_DN1484_c0_g1_i1.p1 TRINITY_DN1484_c0_g1~~TRINITY_DN1484_c0_g1_i1.p1  ORF type:complete len:365 (-),score=78.01 TRINITY_DN1484_c0_g1_i1:57-1151(-)